MPAVTVPRNHLFPPGPCEIAVATESNTRLGVTNDAWEFLGTTREGGQAREIFYTNNVFTDYAGSAGMPADMILSGKGIVVTCQVQNFNPFVMKRLKARFWNGTNGLNKVGQIDQHDMGALLIHEVRYIPVCIRSLGAFPPFNVGASAKYPTNEAGLWIPVCLPHGEMIWDYAAREQTYSLTFYGMTYINTKYALGGDIDPHKLNCVYNAGVLYSVDSADIKRIWATTTNPGA